MITVFLHGWNGKPNILVKDIFDRWVNWFENIKLGILYLIGHVTSAWILEIWEIDVWFECF